MKIPRALSFYKKTLAPPAIELSTAEGKRLFKEALENGTVEGFFKLHSSFQTQSEPAYCGLATLSMVFNALSIDPQRKWKGPWRWFDESMLGCCEPLDKVINEGITFPKAVCLARCAGANVEAFHTNRSTIDEFRKHVISCSSSDDSHMVTSYHRAPFQQSGSGHFSPIGGYHTASDMALILDVARFKYPSHWVPLALLWQAMDTVDQSTGRHRGFMIVSRLLKTPSLDYTWSCKHESWLDSVSYLLNDVYLKLQSSNVTNIKEVLSVVITSFPSNFVEFIRWIEVRRDARTKIKEEVLEQVRETELYKLMDTVHCQMLREVESAFLLALPPRIWSGIRDQKLLQEIQNLVSLDNLPDMLREEILNLRWQFEVLKRCTNKGEPLEDPEG
ncbi:hypothetical protein MKW94_016122 [Papaver nudicaule]|uniref:glutathione gamma-glutamylcysteinyltransferase n=1 Tax=Papaver nudicaule TaxID=74823 RepID=A0AA41S7F3_PAPNU|nr:hypothetical protein [Papaver nudicaule]